MSDEQGSCVVTDEDEIDTGFDAVLAGEVYVAPVTAAVSETPATAQQVADATKALVQLPDKLDAVTLAKLAREIAMDIKETAVVLKEFGLNQTQYDYLAEHNAFFKNALEAACIEWHSPLSTKERVAVAAAAILEDSLPTLGARMQNRGEGLPGVTEAAKLFAKLAGVGERENSGAPSGERFVINIDLGGGKTVALEAGPPPSSADNPFVRGAVPQAALPSGEPLPVQSQPEGRGEIPSLPGEPDVS